MEIRNPNCTVCPLHIGAITAQGAPVGKPPRNVCLMHDDPQKADVMVVAEAPGITDDLEGKIFAAKGLHDFHGIMKNNGLSAYFTYAIKCVKPSREAKFTDPHVKSCAPYLDAEIAQVQPKHIICLGAHALYAVTRKRGLPGKRGNRFYDSRVNAYIYPTIHQAQAIYNEQDKQVLVADLKLFMEWIKGDLGVIETEKVNFEPKVHVVHTVQGLREMREQISAANWVVAVDTETTGLNAFCESGHIRSIQFCWDEKFGGVFVPLNIGEGCYHTDKEKIAPNYWPDENEYAEAIEILREILIKARCIWHNGKFDRIWLYQWGERNWGAPILAPNIYMDTLHVAHLIDENRPLGLKKLITQDLGYPTYDIPDKLTKDLDLLIPYAACDTVASLLLAKKYETWLYEESNLKIRRFYHRVIRKVDALFTKMEMRGWPVDESRAKEVVLILASQATQVEAELLSILEERGAPVTPGCLGSPMKLSKLLFEHLGFTPSPDKKIALTESGGLSTNENALIHLKGDIFIDKLFVWRGLTKALSTYAEPMLRAATTRGRLTTSYKITGTVTGRTASGREGSGKSSNGMNLQNLPHKHGIRSIIKPQDGWSICEADFSQIELRVAGFLSRDPFLLDAYRNNKDMHSLRAMRILGVDEAGWAALSSAEKKDYRSKAKPCIAEGSLVLTKRGLVPIEDVHLSDLVWDGLNWVKHEGVVYKGYKEVITVQGLTATPEHEVWLDDGSYASMKEVQDEGGRLRIAQGGVGSIPTRYAHTDRRHFARGKSSKDQCTLLGVRVDVRHLSGQYTCQEDDQLPVPATYQIRQAKGTIRENSPKQIRGKIRFDQAEMPKPKKCGVPKLRVAGNRASHDEGGVHRLLPTDFSAQRLQGMADRPDRQRWSLRAGESASCNAAAKSMQQADITTCGVQGRTDQSLNAVGKNQDGLQELCIQQRLDSKNACSGSIGGGDHTERNYAHVYDILNAGEYHRFTVDNCVVFNCSFGFIYGMSAIKFKQYALVDYGVNFTLKQCNELRDQYFRDHAALAKWYTLQERRAVKFGYVENLVGRRRHLPNMKIDPERGGESRMKYQDALRQAINTPVQSFASDLKLMALVEIDHKLAAMNAQYKEEVAFLIGEVHDSILVECRDDVAEEVARMCVESMRTPAILDQLGVSLDVPIDAEAKIGPSLGEAKEIQL